VARVYCSMCIVSDRYFNLELNVIFWKEKPSTSLGSYLLVERKKFQIMLLVYFMIHSRRWLAGCYAAGLWILDDHVHRLIKKSDSSCLLSNPAQTKYFRFRVLLLTWVPRYIKKPLLHIDHHPTVSRYGRPLNLIKVNEQFGALINSLHFKNWSAGSTADFCF